MTFGGIPFIATMLFLYFIAMKLIAKAYRKYGKEKEAEAVERDIDKMLCPSKREIKWAIIICAAIGFFSLF